MENIDIVIPWVDGGDPEWQRSFKEYTPNPELSDAKFERYRDWELLKYWFRGVELYAPWVRKIHFITCGQKPDWLDPTHPKLNLVNHSDYIDQANLPVFSSHPIELPIHKIEGLADQFIYFNDDFFLIDSVDKSDFFTAGLPNDAAIMNPVAGGDPMMLHIAVNNLDCINRNFTKSEVISQSRRKWFSPNYKGGLYRNFALLPWPNFPGFLDHHLPQPYLKRTLETVWSHEEGALTRTMSSKFRSISDVNMYLFRYWQLCSGDFHPKSLSPLGAYFDICDDNSNEVAQHIRGGKTKIIVINDGETDKFEAVKQQLIDAFDERLPHKSKFEL